MSISVTTMNAKTACERLFAEAVNIRSTVDQAIVSCSSGTTVVDYLIQVSAVMGSGISTWADCANVPGLNAYAQSALGDPTADLTTEASSLITALNNIVEWIRSNTPQDASGNVFRGKLQLNGTLLNATMDYTQLTGLVNLLKVVQGILT